MADGLYVEVGVTPNTKGFDAAVHSQAQQLFKNHPIQIPTTLTADITAIRVAAESIQRQLETHLKPVSVPIDVNSDQIVKAVQTAVNTAVRTAKPVAVKGWAEKQSAKVTSLYNKISDPDTGLKNSDNQVRVTDKLVSIQAEVDRIAESSEKITVSQRQLIDDMLRSAKALAAQLAVSEKAAVRQAATNQKRDDTNSQREVAQNEAKYAANLKKIAGLEIKLANAKTQERSNVYKAQIRDLEKLNAELLNAIRSKKELNANDLTNRRSSAEASIGYLQQNQEALALAKQRAQSAILTATKLGGGYDTQLLDAVRMKLDQISKTPLYVAVADINELNMLVAALNTNLSETQKQGLMPVDPVAVQTATANFRELGKSWSALFSDASLTTKYTSVLKQLETAGTVDEFKQAQNAVKAFKAEVVAAGKNTISWTDRMGKAIQTLSRYWSIHTVFFMLKRVIGDMIQQVVELDSKVTDLQIASGKSRSAVKAMVREYAEMGKELGATATAVAESADTFLRQGMSSSETNTLIEDSMYLSKLGQIESADAAKALTSAMKGYKVEANDVIGIVDQLTAIDMQAAVSSGDLATAMAQTAVSANNMGIEMNRLLGYLTVMMETTQESPEVIGNTMKTILARMGNIKAGNLTDPESAESLSDVEATLNGLGIKLRTSSSEFRNFGDVFDEVAAKWDKFSTVQQSAIAVAFAGTRQRERFLVMMENYSKAADYANVAAQASGTAEAKYNAYLDSISAKTESFNAQYQAFSQSIMNSELLKMSVDTGTGILKFFTLLNEKLGALPNLFGAIGLGAFAKTVGNMKKASIFVQGLGSVTAYQPGGDLTAVAADYVTLSKAQQRAMMTTLQLDKAEQQYVRTIAKMISSGQLISTSLITETTLYKSLDETQKRRVLTLIQEYSVEKAGELIQRDSVEALAQRLVAEGLCTEAEAAQTAQVILNTAAIKANTGSMKLNTKAALAMMLSNPATWIMAAISAISILTKVIKDNTTSYEEQVEVLDEARSKAEEANRAYEDVNNELQTTAARIEELQALSDAGTISFVERQELDNLKASNELLYERVQLLKAEAEIARRQHEDEFEETYKKASQGTSTTYTAPNGRVRVISEDYSKIEKNISKYDNARLRKAYGLGYDDIFKMRKQDIADIQDQISDVNAQILAADPSDDKLINKLQKKRQKLEKALEFEKSQISQLAGDFSESYNQLFSDVNGDFSKLSPAVRTAMETIKTWRDFIVSGFSDADTHELSYDSVVATGEYNDIVAQMTNLAKNAQLTTDTINSADFAPFVNALTSLGVPIDWIIRKFNTMASESNSATNGTLTAIEEYARRNDHAYTSSKVSSALDSVLGEYNDTGVVTKDTLDELEKALPGVQNALLKSNGTWSEAGKYVLGYADNLNAAVIAMYDAMIAQEQQKRRELIAERDTNPVDGYDYQSQLSTYDRNIDSYIKQKDSFVASQTSAIKNAISQSASSADQLVTVLAYVKEGMVAALDPELVSEVVEEFPELRDELEALTDGTEDAAKAADEFQDSLDRRAFEDFEGALGDLQSAQEEYSTDSSEVLNAMLALEAAVPGLSGQLVAADGSYTNLGAAALLAASGNKEAALQILNAAAAAAQLNLSNARAEMAGLAADASAAAINTAAMNEAMAGAQYDAVMAMIEKVKNDGFSGGGSSGRGGGGGGKKDVLEAYKNQKKILEHRIEMSEAAQDVMSEESDAWESEQQKQYELYKEYAALIQAEIERLRQLGYDSYSDELMQLEKDLASVQKSMYDIAKAAWEKQRDAQIKALRKQKEEAEKAHRKEMERLEAEIQRHETLLGLYESQHDLTKSLGDERRALEKELAKANSYTGLSDDERESLFTNADYAQLVSVLDEIQNEAVVAYNNYVQKIKGVNVEEAYKLDYITSEYEAQYALMAKKYEIAKQDLAVARARIALENAQKNRNVAMLVNGQWTWSADPQAIEEAMDEIWDAEQEKADAESDFLHQQKINEFEMFIASIELQKEAAEAQHEKLMEQIDELIEALEEMEFAFDDCISGLHGAASAINGAISAIHSAASAGVSQINSAAAAGAAKLSASTRAVIDAMGVVDVDGDGAYTRSDRNATRAALKELEGHYASGGVVDYTGGAQVHGSKSAPEVVFNAKDAAKLYDIIHNGNPIASMIESVSKQLRASTSLAAPQTPVHTQSPIQYIVNGLTFGESAGNLTLRELATRLTSAAPLLH